MGHLRTQTKPFTVITHRWAWRQGGGPIVLCLLGMLLGCGDDRRNSDEATGCRSSCRLLLECTLGQSAEAVTECQASCIDSLNASSRECRAATAAVGRCAGGLDCEALTGGTCDQELEAAAVACGTSDGGLDGGAGRLDGAGGDGGVDGGADDCSRFSFEVTGQPCPDTGCPSLNCDCIVGFPVSLTACTDDGCLAGADCGKVCTEGVAASLACDDTYSIAIADGGPPPMDAGRDAGPPPPMDAGRDAGPPPRDAGHDAGPPPPRDAGQDAGPPPPRDAGHDAGPPPPRDAGWDACMPRACVPMVDCGTVNLGCGLATDCGGCAAAAWCAGGGVAHRCGCTPQTLGYRSVATARSGPGPGVAWVDPTNVTGADAMIAAAALRSSTADSNALVADQLGFALPPTARVDGIEVRVRRRAGAGRVRDGEVVLVRNGVALPISRAVMTPWPVALANATYGGPTDTWGESWTGADINRSNFGVAISAQHTGGGPDIAEIDHIEVRVHIGCP